MHTRARGQNNKVHTEGTKADTNIFRLNALYQRKTMSDYGRYGMACNYGSLEEHKSVFTTVFFFFSAQSGPRPPQRACCTDKTLLLHEWASSICTSYISVSEAARQPMHSNYLQSCLRTPNSHTFKFKRLYWQWKGGVGGRIQQKHRGASVGAGNAIIQLMMTLNGTIMAPW